MLLLSSSCIVTNLLIAEGNVATVCINQFMDQSEAITLVFFLDHSGNSTQSAVVVTANL